MEHVLVTLPKEPRGNALTLPVYAHCEMPFDFGLPDLCTINHFLYSLQNCAQARHDLKFVIISTELHMKIPPECQIKSKFRCLWTFCFEHPNIPFASFLMRFCEKSRIILTLCSIFSSVLIFCKIVAPKIFPTFKRTNGGIFRRAGSGAPFRVRERKSERTFLAQLKPYDDALKRTVDIHNSLDHRGIEQYHQVVRDGQLALVVFEKLVSWRQIQKSR